MLETNTIKLDSEGNPDQYKFRIFVCGCMQKEHKNYKNTLLSSLSFAHMKMFTSAAV
jgi:hypothetical protein